MKHLCGMVLRTPHVRAYARPRTEKHRRAPAERLNEALGAIRVLGVEPVEDGLEPHLKTVLSSVEDSGQCHGPHVHALS